LEELTTSNTRLQEQAVELENQLRGSVAQQEWDTLQTEHSQLQKTLESMTLERDKKSGRDHSYGT